MDFFIEKCREVYFCTDDFSEATFIVTNVGLYNIFIELAYVEHQSDIRDEYQGYVQMCKENLEATLANLNILMPANLESIVALALGVSLSSLAEFVTSITDRYRRCTELRSRNHRLAGLLPHQQCICAKL